jgi:hypothetical protein
MIKDEGLMINEGQDGGLVVSIQYLGGEGESNLRSAIFD